MNTYIVLLRGVNVSGKNKVSMADLRHNLETSGYSNVRTYINSGNVILESTKTTTQIKADIELRLPNWFTLDSDILKIHVITSEMLESVVKAKPAGFGEKPLEYYSEVVFLMDIDIDQAFNAFTPRDGVDCVWRGDTVIYLQRLKSELSKSRLNKVMVSPLYKSMTMRNWNTTAKLYEIANGR